MSYTKEEEDIIRQAAFEGHGEISYEKVEELALKLNRTNRSVISKIQYMQITYIKEPKNIIQNKYLPSAIQSKTGKVIPFGFQPSTTKKAFLYIMGGCYHDFKENSPLYYFKLGMAKCPQSRAKNLGMHLLFQFEDAANWEKPYLWALDETLGKNRDARHYGGGSMECFGRFDTWKQLLEYTSDLATEIQEHINSERTQLYIPVPKRALA